MKAITQRLRVLRAALDLSQRETAARSGIEVTRYWHIENGYKTPSSEEIEALAIVLKVTPPEILADEQSVVP